MQRLRHSFLLLGLLALLALPLVAGAVCEETQEVQCGQDCLLSGGIYSCNLPAAPTRGCFLLSNNTGCIDGPFPDCNCGPGG